MKGDEAGKIDHRLSETTLTRLKGPQDRQYEF
jgi:hypothetical protein